MDHPAPCSFIVTSPNKDPLQEAGGGWLTLVSYRTQAALQAEVDFSNRSPTRVFLYVRKLVTVPHASTKTLRENRIAPESSSIQERCWQIQEKDVCVLTEPKMGLRKSGREEFMVSSVAQAEWRKTT